MKITIQILLIVLLYGLSVSVCAQGRPVSIPPLREGTSQIIVLPAPTRFLSIKDFGAVGDGVHDDADAVQVAVDYVIKHPQPLIVPIGAYILSHSIFAQNNGKFFTIHLIGVLPNKSASNEYLSRFIYMPKSGFAFGVQLGRGIKFENISVQGQYQFWQQVSYANIATLKFSDWIDPTITDTRNAPYVGIAIDPYPNANGSAQGTSGVDIIQCAIKQFMVGIALSPNGSTLNDEMINIIDDDIENNRVAVAICQDQSKEIHIDRLKCWGGTHTIIDGITYGRGQGGGSVDMTGGNIAGCVNELVNINTDRFNFTSTNLHMESVYRIGNVGYGAGATFINLQSDFLTGPNVPEADYIISGQANFYGGCLRYYDNDITHRMNLTNFGGALRDMVLNTIPFTKGLYGGGSFPEPIFENVNLYYYAGSGGKKLTYPFETLTNMRADIAFDKANWTAKLTRHDDPLPPMAVGDLILGSPSSTGRRYYDEYCNPYNCTTVLVGRVTAINGGVISLDRVSLNAPNIGYDAFYVSKVNQ